ncbi:MAG: nucleoside phosphorylase [Candidatus Nanoarchaeia archaeon]
MIPNFNEKYHKEAIFTPEMALQYRIKREGKPNFPVPNGVIFCINWDLLNYILENNEYDEVEGFFARCYLLRKENILVISKFGIGAPTTIALFEELIAYGVKNFISIGNAGGISADVNIGDIVVCEKAIRDEGVSYHYVPASKYAQSSLNMTRILKEVLSNKNIDFCSGVSWTTDAFFRETIEEVEHYQKEDVLTVEMEASALFAVAEYRNVNISVLFTISDSLAKLKWDPKWHAPEVKYSYKKLFEASIETINKL